MADNEEAPRDRVGFGRAEMFSEVLAGTVKTYGTHLFVCSGLSGGEWAHDTSKVEGSAHSALEAVLSERKGALGSVKTTLFAAEEGDSEGDVWAFPHALHLRPVHHAATQPGAWAEEVAQLLAEGCGVALQSPAHVFVCAHARRDKRCGTCGPALLQRLRDDLAQREGAGDSRRVTVRACSHVGGHAYAGNVLVFAPRAGQSQLTGDWYGYVQPQDVGELLDTRIRDGVNLHALWRGAMGLTPEECKKAAEAACGDCAGCDS